ncbi:hypothetical protein GOP47_0017247, partial [Adiantum capillus-veneris]
STVPILTNHGWQPCLLPPPPPPPPPLAKPPYFCELGLLGNLLPCERNSCTTSDVLVCRKFGRFCFMGRGGGMVQSIATGMRGSSPLCLFSLTMGGFSTGCRDCNIQQKSPCDRELVHDSFRRCCHLLLVTLRSLTCFSDLLEVDLGGW